jgi:hypothetical protein
MVQELKVNEAGGGRESVHRYGPMCVLTNADAATVRANVSYSLAYVIEEFEKFTQNGSGWGVEVVEKIDLRIDRYQPGRGASYLPSPAWINAKKCTINVQNEDNECFRYALISAIDRPEKNAHRVTSYKKPERRNIFKLAGIEMPAPATDSTFKRFEAQNPGYSLLVYRCPIQSTDRDDLCVPSRSPHKDRTMIPLILLYDAESKEGVKSHYISVTNMNALIRMMVVSKPRAGIACTHLLGRMLVPTWKCISGIPAIPNVLSYRSRVRMTSLSSVIGIRH